MTATEPILTETIGNTTLSLREIQNGGYLISASGECNAKVFKTLLEEAENEFGYMVFKATIYQFGEEQYL